MVEATAVVRRLGTSANTMAARLFAVSAGGARLRDNTGDSVIAQLVVFREEMQAKGSGARVCGRGCSADC